MRYELDLHAYDYMDKISIYCRLTDTQREFVEGQPPDVTRSLTLDGWGEHDPSHWLIAVLQEVLESL